MKRVKSVLMSAILAATMVVTNFAGAIPSGVLAATPLEETQNAVTAAQTSVGDNELKAEVPVKESEPQGEKVEVDINKELSDAQKNLSDAGTNLSNADQYAKELESVDEKGNYTGLINDAMGSYKDAYGAVNNNKDMEIVLKPETDEDGNIIYIDVLDENGNPVTDEDGNVKKTPKYKVVGFAEADQKTEKGADGAITNAKTANTSDSETVARAAAGNAVNDLNAAEAGLKAAGDDVDDAQKAVNAAAAKYDAAVKAANAAREKYNALQEELKNAQINATAAHEHLKAAEKAANALADKADDAYLEYIGAKDNQELQKIFDKVAEHYDKMIMEDGTTNSHEVDKLSQALLEYYLTTGKLVAYDYSNNTAVKYGSDFAVPNPYVFQVTIGGETYTLRNKKWDDDKALEKLITEKNGELIEEDARFNANGFVYAGYKWSDNRMVITFKDEDGKGREFYFNYKKNGDGTIYVYQRIFSEENGTIKWESDYDSQNRARGVGQLSKDEETGKVTNDNFDYVEAMNKKHASDKLSNANSKISDAEEATKKFSGYVDGLVNEYDDKTEPVSRFYGALRELDQSLASLKAQLDSAKATLAAALDRKASLEIKVEEARAAVRAIDLSRFGGSSDDDADSDDAGSDDVSNISLVPLTQDTTGVFGARTPRVAGGGAVADRGVAGVRQAGADNTGAQNSINNANAVNTEGTATTKKLADNTVPLAANVEASNTSSVNYIWLLAVAAAVAVGAGVYAYDKRKKALAHSAKGQK